MVDIHCHILHGLDDGARTLEESVVMVRMAAEAGVTDMVATPHANLKYPFQPDLVLERLNELRAVLGRTAPRIHTGCDFHLSYDNIQDALAHPRKYTINHKNYLLVEFSDLEIFPTTAEILESLLRAGMIPVITHPERNELLRMQLGNLRKWVGMGCLLQVTGEAFLGRWGKSARRFSHEMMKEGLVHVVASDAHDTEWRPPALAEVRAYLEKHYGAAAPRCLLIENPQAILEGKPLPEAPPAPAPVRKWYRFWG
jgi:protein-tyrosine phosphatase